MPVCATGVDRHVADRPVLDVGVAAAGRQQPQEVRLARAVGAEHRHPLAVPDLEVERLHQAGQLEPLADTARLPVRPPLEPHRDLSARAAISCGGPASSNLRSRVCAAW